jgi:glycosyltransferase involved in cell wall biosynthesis
MVTIVYAFRNRDVLRVKASLDSLQQQTHPDFKVIFVDYGSETYLATEIEKLISTYNFANYYYVPSTTLLWNKSKALNYGISKATTPFIFIADVDLIFHQNTVTLFHKIANADKAILFKLGYLTKEESKKIETPIAFESLKPKHFGYVNGMVLCSKKALEQINGYDTFFHFYGSEDVDLYVRLEHAGITIEQREEAYFFHNWHVIYNSYNDEVMSKTPRLYNVKRINQQHYFFHQQHKIIVPFNQEEFGTVVKKEDQEQLLQPTKIVELPNIHAVMHHFICVQLPTFKNEIVKITIQEDAYYRSLKHYLKKLLKKQSQPYVSIKQVNDLLLTEILYRYKHHNYAYEISDDLKKVIFTIKL